jgi:polyhydroxyalkanoate synthesis regulator protein
MQRRNLELLQKSFSLFNPFATVAPTADTKDRKIDELTKEVAKLNAEIDKVRKGGK